MNEYFKTRPRGEGGDFLLFEPRQGLFIEDLKVHNQVQTLI
jgi:hypothetical protein